MSLKLEIRQLTKRFGTKTVNHKISLTIEPGTIHTLVGENGAGKSTLLKCLSGLHLPDEGSFHVDCTEIQCNSIWNPRVAAGLGIGMVYQHLLLADAESVLDNIVAGSEIYRFGFFRNRRKEEKKILNLMQQTNLFLDLSAKVSDLSIGMQSRCEILKVLYKNPKLIIFDEPTSVLSPQETKDFLKSILNLKQNGHTILLVTHKLKEVLEVSDFITVLKQGEIQATLSKEEANPEKISELMVGKTVVFPQNRLTADNKVVFSSKDYGFEVKRKEIIGVAGVDGNGQRELTQSILKSVENIKNIHLAYIPADRHLEGLTLELKNYENLRISLKFRKTPFFIPFRKPLATENLLYKKFNIMPPSPFEFTENLSGGNQQKLIAARELSDLPETNLVLACYPTRGVDIGAIRLLHEHLLQCAENGSAVILISNELEEVMNLSHKIGVLYKGRFQYWFEGPVFEEKKIGLAMMGTL